MKADLSVYLVTDAAMAGGDVAGVAAAAVAGGVTTVQVREKHQGAAQFLATVVAVADALPESVTLLVNDRVDVFLAARALGAPVDGVHVGQSDLPPAAVRELIGPDALIGLSASTTQQLQAAEADGVDYVGIGIVHPTSTKKDAPPPMGVDGFARLAAAARLPAVAIGGITPADMAPLRAAGAAGAAIVSGICAASDPQAAARAHATAWAS